MAAGADLPRFDSLAFGGTTVEEARRAALHAVLAGTSIGERRDFLDALGLLPTTRITTHNLAGFQAGCVCRACRKAHATHQRYHNARTEAP